MTKNEAGPNAKAPAVYLNDNVLAEIGGKRDGKISKLEIVEELLKADVPRKDGGIGCSCCSS